MSIDLTGLLESMKKYRQRDNVGKQNPLDTIELFLCTKWPELYTMKNVWVTGGTIWRPVYGLPISGAKDIDVVATSWWSMRKLCKFMESIRTPDCCQNGETSMGGIMYHSHRGRADVWRGNSIKGVLERYTGDVSNVRMAYSPYEQRLIVLPTGK